MDGIWILIFGIFIIGTFIAITRKGSSFGGSDVHVKPASQSKRKAAPPPAPHSNKNKT